MPVPRSALALFACLALAACAGDVIPVSSSYDPLERFPAQATLAWDDAANVLPSDPAIDRAGTDAMFRELAEEGFAAHGYRVVPGGTPNYRLSYQYAIHTYIGADVSRAYGSLSLLLTDAATGRRVWIGFGRAQIHVGLTLDERKARLRKALAEMLEKFPPSQRSEG